ncbi:S1 family peptidase [Streptomyces liangshanensis]|uniref:Trypsin-like peptidase domain-containing protein n=1 Tax=Streptomyces liangshanensis TaxID=2717324 RepID=A0A6G9H851_9ACTN|nr:serine protease [Streptomyces liangshanensis]QIQ06391.1 trypsin-like peptidase domain-containing protein [Streptomyces liangshanensis]
MRKPLLGALLAVLLLGAGAAPATATGLDAAAPAKTASTAPAGTTAVGGTAAAVKAVSYAGTVALSNCSGSVVRTPGSQPNDFALVLSNGHCLESGFPAAGQVIVNQPSSRTFTLLNAAGTGVATLRASRIAYATMTDTDVSLYQLTSTYAQIQSRYAITALDLNTTRPVQGTAIKVVSGYWKRIYTCNVDGFAYQLKEGQWTWKDSVRYTSACNTIGGTSGSPVIDTATGKVVAVNNTGNESGGRCTDNNPCEVDQSGNVTVRQGINYAQETYQIVPCVGTGTKIDLSLAGCALPKP